MSWLLQCSGWQESNYLWLFVICSPVYEAVGEA
uniref:Uncharacterized protein n=1 Tax=Rhizophora mucronata TaxID=61149 RepID=A0A2P2PFI1_RHIMU